MPRRIAFFDLDHEAAPDFPSEQSPTKANGSHIGETRERSPDEPTNNGKPWRAVPANWKPLEWCSCSECRKARRQSNAEADKAIDRRDTAIAIAVAIVLALVVSFLKSGS